jgi:hypothetical protein
MSNNYDCTNLKTNNGNITVCNNNGLQTVTFPQQRITNENSWRQTWKDMCGNDTSKCTPDYIESQVRKSVIQDRINSVASNQNTLSQHLTKGYINALGLCNEDKTMLKNIITENINHVKCQNNTNVFDQSNNTNILKANMFVNYVCNVGYDSNNYHYCGGD